MTVKHRIDQALDQALSLATGRNCPPRLRMALQHAVFPGGGRLRPRLVLGVAQACGEDHPELSDAAAVAIELLHCASLVHDDLPCFDDAESRRGRPTVHRAHGEALAVLCGDALIVHAFDTLALQLSQHPQRAGQLLRIISRGVGACGGIVGGQAWESEPAPDLSEYHRAKTGALFEAAITAGAAAAGAEVSAWEGVGLKLGEAYQVADDIADVLADPNELGKPVGRDVHFARPSAVLRLGIEGATARLNELLEAAVQSLPACPGRSQLQEQFAATATKHLARRARPAARMQDRAAQQLQEQGR